MKNLINYYFKSLFSKKSITKVKSSEKNQKNEFDFKVISEKERLNNRCKEYEFIID